MSDFSVNPISGAAPNSNGTNDVTTTKTNWDGTVSTTVAGPAGNVISTATTNATRTITELNADGSESTVVIGPTGTVISTITTAGAAGAPAPTGVDAYNGTYAGSSGSLGVTDLRA